jgi:lipopolysaccharide biosynthesis glycosyltransferase
MVKKTAIVSFFTKNCTHELSENTQESFTQAANKWSSDNIVFNDPVQPPGFHDMFTKLFLCNYLHDYDQCIYLDTDMIINSKAPNPFELFNDEECCYVVRDLQTETVTPKQKYSLKKTRLCGPWYATLKQIIKTDITKQQFFDNFFNAGMFIFSPKKHKHIFSAIQQALQYLPQEYYPIHQVEQALLNLYFMTLLKDKLIYIPQVWNYLDPPIDTKTMEGYIYHFNGFFPDEVKKCIYTYDKWR